MEKEDDEVENHSPDADEEPQSSQEQIASDPQTDETKEEFEFPDTEIDLQHVSGAKYVYSISCVNEESFTDFLLHEDICYVTSLF